MEALFNQTRLTSQLPSYQLVSRNARASYDIAKLSSSQVELRLALLSLSGYQVGYVFTYLGMYTYLFQKLGM